MPAMLTSVPRDPRPRILRPELVEILPLIRERLLEQRRFRLDQLAGLTTGAGRRGAAHDEVATVLAAGARHTLADIDAALSRIDAGTFGACLDCGRPIEEAQLRDVPRIALCLTCRRRSHPG